jgi:hypothetical protein
MCLYVLSPCNTSSFSHPCNYRCAVLINEWFDPLIWVTKAENSRNSSTKPKLSNKATASASFGLLLMHFAYLTKKMITLKPDTPLVWITVPLCGFLSGLDVTPYWPTVTFLLSALISGSKILMSQLHCYMDTTLCMVFFEHLKGYPCYYILYKNPQAELLLEI